jgi:hypothetical protein
MRNFAVDKLGRYPLGVIKVNTIIAGRGGTHL